MRHALVAAVALSVLGCSEAPTPGTPRENPRKIEGVQGYLMGEPIRHENATFVPILTEVQDPKDEIARDVVTLAEAKKNGWVEIIEVPGDEQVDTLKVRNSGPKPLLLLAGDLLLGGKQDRVVAKDTMIEPGDTRSVGVYCVEHGRWSSGRKQFAYSNTMVPDRVRKAAQYESQQSVWDNVASANAEAVASPESSSIRELVNDKETQDKVASGVSSVKEKLSGDNVVGVLFVLNGEIQTLEMFGSPGLFSAAVEPLLKSFLAEAAIAPKAAGKAHDTEEWSEFVAKCLTAERDADAVGNTAIAGAGIRGQEYKSKAMAPAEHGSYSLAK